MERHFYRDKRTTSTYSGGWYGDLCTQATRVTDEMFIEAGQAVADQVPSELVNQGLLYSL
jgi:malic enzyme